MRDLRRVHPPDKEVLRGINISMYPGAKIGVLGLNGAGKSTLLRIIAGEDDGYQRRSAGSRPASRVGFLPAGAAARPDEGRARQRHRRRRAHEGPARPVRRGLQRDGRARRRLRQAARRAGRAPGPDRRGRTAGISTASSRSRWTRCGCPPADADVDEAVAAVSAAASRCAGCCSSKPDLLLLDEPTNHLDAESVAWLERHLQEYHGTVVAVTHDRYFLDNVAGWILELDRGHGIPWEGNYSSWLEQKDAAARAGGEGRRDAPAHARSASSSGSAWRRAPGRPRARRASTRTTSSSPKRRRPSGARTKLQISIPPGPAARRPRRRGRAPAQGLRRPAAHRRSLVLAAAAAASSA